jgi:hypothetical protein
MNQGVITQAGFPVIQVMSHIFCRTDEFQGAIIDVSFEELSKGVLLLMLPKFVFALLDLSFDVRSPIS